MLKRTRSTNNNNAMNRSLFVTAALVAGLAAASAQTPAAQRADTLASECLLNTDERAWSSLGLTTEQVSQVRAIQTECKTDCVALNKEAARDGAMSPAILAKHQERIQNVLTQEQYGKWLEWCSENDGHTRVK